MTDKMREAIRDAHDTARNKAWREEPGTFDTLDAFKAGAAWQAAQSVPVVGEVVGSVFIQNNGFISCVSQRPETGKNAGGRWVQAVEKPTHSISAAELERLRKDAWQGIETAPTDGTDVDLYGYLAYDVTDIRLTNCAFTDGEWKYFVCGEMRPITDIAFTPEYWRPIIAPSIDAAIAAEGEK